MKDTTQNGLSASLEVSKDELIKTVNSLPEEVMFNIVCFGTEVSSWQKALVQAVQ